MKNCYSFVLAIFLLLGINAAFAQHSVNCPGVPGACGYVPSAAQSRASATNSPQNGSGTLGNIYNQSKCGLNYIAVSNRLGQRFTPAGVLQPAPFVVSGLSPCDSIEKAYLWVEGSGTGAAQTVTIQPPSGPSQNFPMTIVGTGPDKCWGYTSSVTYRADVTSVINGNGTYNLSNVFTNPPTAGEDMDGATLVIIYSNSTQPWQGTIVLDDGAFVVNGGTATYAMNYPAVCGATTNAQAFICVGDIQMPVGSLTMNGTPAAFSWDWWNYVSVATTVNVGQTSSVYDLNTSGDCFNLCVAGLYYQTTSCAVCPTSSPTLNLAASSSPASSCTTCDGTATVTPSPAGTYTYSWSPGGQTTQTATNLCSGVYTVTVSGSCLVSTQTVSVGNPANLSATSTAVNVSCFGNTDGMAIVSPSGGQGPYTFSWAPVSGSNDTLSSIGSGTYSCTITDANGCTYVQAVTITQPPGFSVTANVTNIACNGLSNGMAVAVANGGNPGYTYAWLPSGPNNDTLTNLAAGSYTVNVTDANGCGGTQTFNITEPPALTGTLTVIPAGCNGPGSATILVSGGVGNYSYLWSSGGTSATELNLTVGSYIITVTDANGCSLIDTAVVTSANAVTVTPSQTNITCFGNTDGSATVTPSGGQPPYTYAWSPFGGNNATATNLSSGTYTCTITDANGCTATQIFFIVEPAAITTTMNSIPVSCNGGSDGSATMNISGGSPPFTFSWLPTGGNGATANGLPAGTYTVLATDSSGCSTSQTVTISQPSVLTVGTSPDTACAGGTATISATGAGGVGPYSYSWSSGGQSQTETVSPSVATTYTVVVTDSHGCSNTATVTVPVFPVPTAAFTTSAVNGIFTLASNPLCLNDASVNATSWYWNFNGQDTSFQQSPCIVLSPADTGSYCIILIASTSAGCLDTAETCIEVTDVSYSIPNVFTPNADGNNDAFIISNRGMKSLHCRIYDRWGVLIYEWDGTTGSWDGRTKNGKDAVDGVYYYAAFLEDYSGKTYDESGFVHLIRGGN